MTEPITRHGDQARSSFRSFTEGGYTHLAPSRKGVLLWLARLWYLSFLPSNIVGGANATTLLSWLVARNSVQVAVHKHHWL